MKRYKKIDVNTYIQHHDCRSYAERRTSLIREIRSIDPDYGYKTETKYQVIILGEVQLLTLDEWADLCHQSGEIFEPIEVTIRINLLKRKR